MNFVIENLESFFYLLEVFFSDFFDSNLKAFFKKMSLVDLDQITYNWKGPRSNSIVDLYKFMYFFLNDLTLGAYFFF